jgi:hypothetical protein
MASSLKKLTGMGGDVRKIAALLQAKAPKGHKLAYINDEEAALLKSRGGSGKPHADTGIPSFELDDSFALQGDTSGGPSEVAATPQTYGSTSGDAYSSAPVQLGGDYSSTRSLASAPAPAPTGEAAQLSSFPQPITPTSTPDAARLQEAGGRQLAELTAQPTTPPKTDTGISDETMKRLGLAGVVGLLGSRQAGKAAESGKAGAQQLQNIAAPYQQAGAQLQAQAQRGELTPQAQQSLQAIQAQAAQGAERRGGVGAQQIQAQVEAFRQQLLAQQYDYGLKLSGIGDNIAMGAIKTGLQADQYVNQLTNNYYSNIARVAFGSAPQVAGVPSTTPAG